MSSMGTGTKIGFILISILVVIVIANLLNNKVQDGPSGEEQVTGRSTSPEPEARKPVSQLRKAATPAPVTASGRGASRSALPVRNSQKSTTATDTSSVRPAVASGQPARGTARLDQVQVKRTTGVLRNDSPTPLPKNSQVTSPRRTGESRSTTASTAPPVAPKREFNKVVVEEGDNLWKLAERHLGSGLAYTEILKANRGLTENSILSPGLVLKVPTQIEKKSALAAKAPAVARNGRSYEIQDGDSLWLIASEQLGDGTRYKEIEKANPGENLQVLRIGKVIQLPRQ